LISAGETVSVVVSVLIDSLVELFGRMGSHPKVVAEQVNRTKVKIVRIMSLNCLLNCKNIVMIGLT
jgi:hypothetical protein